MSPEHITRQVRHRFTFILERLLVRGAHYRLLVIVAILGLLSVTGGGLVMMRNGGFDDPSEAFWWAFLRLTDPGYLGDDEGVFRRIVSTGLTIAGYVMFMGALVATMTQWLNATINRLELGLTPVRMRNHVAILGWTDRTVELIRELVLSQGEIRRRIGPWRAGNLKIAVLAERVGPALVADLREELGRVFRTSQIILRSGSPLRIEHLERVDIRHASAVVVPGGDFTPVGAASQDARIMKMLLTVNALVRSGDDDPPAFVGELYDQRTVPSVNDAYPGRVELVATECLVGRMLASGILQPGLTAVHQQLLTHSDTNSLTICEDHELGGETWLCASQAFHRATLLGRIRQVEGKATIELNPRLDTLVDANDLLVVVAQTEDDARPGPCPTLELPSQRTQPLATRHVDRLLVFGWNRKAPAVLAELDRHVPDCRVRIVSHLSQEQRLRDTAADGVELSRLDVEHVVGDYIDPSLVESAEPHLFDRVLLLSSEAMATREEADARTIAAYLLLSEYYEHHGGSPDILVELTDPDDASLLRRYPVQVLTSPRLVSHILAQVVLRRELHLVIDDLLGGGGADLRLVPAGDYGLEGTVDYAHIVRRVREAGHTPVGVRLVEGSDVALNPTPDASFDLHPDDGIIVVA